MNQYTSFFGKCKSAASILQKRRARNAEWEDNLRHPERFLHQKVNRDGMKRCACCGRLFKPTRFHEDDQLYCKDDECKRQRDNYRDRKAYKERVSTREGKIEHYQKSKAKRTMVEEAIGIEHSEDKYARKRNAVRRKLEEMKEKLDSMLYALLGMVVSFGLPTADLVVEKIRDFIKMGEELFLKSIENG